MTCHCMDPVTCHDPESHDRPRPCFDCDLSIPCGAETLVRIGTRLRPLCEACAAEYADDGYDEQDADDEAADIAFELERAKS